MNRRDLPFILLILLLVSSCDTNETGAEPEATCIEGWVEKDDNNSIYYQKCPQDNTKCRKTIRVFLNVLGYWNEGPGILTVRNIENGKVEEFQKEQLIYRHRFQVNMVYDQSRNFTHEITLELPSDKCTINGEKYRYTYALDIPCRGYADLTFEVCADTGGSL